MNQQSTETANARVADETESAKRPVEVGWVLVGEFDAVDLEAIEQSRRAVMEQLQAAFPRFEWRLPMVRRESLKDGDVRTEPSALLDRGSNERELYQWDFALVFTGADLVSHYKSYAIAAISRSLDLAVISTSRVDPAAANPNAEPEQRMERMARSLKVLAMHALGHLCGLSHCPDRSDYMFDVNTIEELSLMHELDDDQQQRMRDALEQIADLRLEEQENVERSNAVSFYVRNAWINKGDIVDSIWQAKPWQFPRHLSRLTAAAVSAALVLMMTAETWEFSLAQSPATVILLDVFALFFTTAFVVRRHHLLVQRKKRRMSEQIASANVSTVGIVGLGMATMLVLLLVATVTAGILLFRVGVVANWSSRSPEAIEALHYLQLAGVVSAVGLLIGSLGASFEEREFFRHVTFVDEEI